MLFDTLPERDVGFWIVENQENRKRVVRPIFSVARLAVIDIAVAARAEVRRPRFDLQSDKLAAGLAVRIALLRLRIDAIVAGRLFAKIQLSRVNIRPTA